MGDSLHISTEEMWDLINIAYKNSMQPLMYGLATDDAHNYHNTGLKWKNAGRGWIMVRAASLSAGSLIESIQAGRFYASTGVVLDDISFRRDRLRISIRTEPGIEYRTIFTGCSYGEDKPSVLEEVTGGKAEYNVTGDLMFVRAKVISSKPKENPNYEGEYEVAWVQPVHW
jgi:hypothetical protein